MDWHKIEDIKEMYHDGTPGWITLLSLGLITGLHVRTVGIKLVNTKGETKKVIFQSDTIKR